MADTNNWIGIYSDERVKYADKFARIETRIEEREKALLLAHDKLSAHLEQMNGLQRKMDRAQELFATKSEHNSLARLVYIGLGIVLALQFFFNWTKP